MPTAVAEAPQVSLLAHRISGSGCLHDATPSALTAVHEMRHQFRANFSLENLLTLLNLTIHAANSNADNMSESYTWNMQVKPFKTIGIS